MSMNCKIFSNIFQYIIKASISNYIKEINLDGCRMIIDFSPISKCEKLEILRIQYSNISDISFL